jgi:hypothetical protein
LAGDFAILIFQSFISSVPLRLARTLAGTRIGTGTLATHGQTTTMAEAAVASDVHQTLDIHRGFTTQITFNRELGDLIADFFQITVGQDP